MRHYAADTMVANKLRFFCVAVALLLGALCESKSLFSNDQDVNTNAHYRVPTIVGPGVSGYNSGGTQGLSQSYNYRGGGGFHGPQSTGSDSHGGYQPETTTPMSSYTNAGRPGQQFNIRPPQFSPVKVVGPGINFTLNGFELPDISFMWEQRPPYSYQHQQSFGVYQQKQAYDAYKSYSTGGGDDKKCDDARATRYFDFANNLYTIVNGALFNEDGAALGFVLVGAASPGALVFDGDDVLVGVVSAAFGQDRYSITSAGVEATFSFGSGTYRVDQRGFVVTADGTMQQVGNGGFTVVDSAVLNNDGVQVGVIRRRNVDGGDFYIISNGGSGLPFLFEIGSNGEVLDPSNGGNTIRQGFVFREADGAVLDCNGDIRAFVEDDGCVLDAGIARRYFDFGDGTIYTIVGSALFDQGGAVVAGGGFTVVGGAAVGARVFDGDDFLVGIVRAAVGQAGYLIASAGVEATYSFGSGQFRLDQSGFVVNAADGSAFGDGSFTVVDNAVLNADGVQVGVVYGDVGGLFFIISNGGSGVDFEFSISVGANLDVLDSNGAALDGFVFRQSDGAVIDCNGDIRAFFGNRRQGCLRATRYFHFGGGVYTIDNNGVVFRGSAVTGFLVIGSAVEGALVFDGQGFVVGIVGDVVVGQGGGYLIETAGVQATFSFGSAPYRLGQGRSVVNADGTAVGNGQFTVMGVTVRNGDGVQVGVIHGDVQGQFHIISNGGSGLEFLFSIGSNGVVLDANGAVREGFVFRAADGAVIDCNGDIRAFADVDDCDVGGGFATRYFDFGNAVYTIVDGALFDENGAAFGDFIVVGGAAPGAMVFDDDDFLVGIVGAAVGLEGYLIASAGVEATYSFGSGQFRLDQSGFVVNAADGTAVGDGSFTVVDNAVLNADGVQVGQLYGDVGGLFFIISNGGSGVDFAYSIGGNLEVLDSNGASLEGFVFRQSDGAVIDCNGDIRAFFGNRRQGCVRATRYFDFDRVYTIDNGVVFDQFGSAVAGFLVVGSTVEGALVFDGLGFVVGIVGARVDQGYLIQTAGVQATFSFGSAPYRLGQGRSVVNADGTAVGNGQFTVMGVTVRNGRGVQVGVVHGDVSGQFHIISNGGSGLDFLFSIGSNREVLDANGAVREGFVFRAADGAVIDCNGDIRAFVDVPDECGDGFVRRYFDFGSSVYRIQGGALLGGQQAVGFTVAGVAAPGALVFDGDDFLVGIVGAAVGQGYMIQSAGVEATFSFGSGLYRFDQNGFVVNTDDGSAVGPGFTVEGGAVINGDGVQVGVVHSGIDGSFYIISNGGNGLPFTFQISADLDVLDSNGDIIAGFLFRAADGAVIDCQGNIRAVLGRRNECDYGFAKRYFDFINKVYRINGGQLLAEDGSTVDDGFFVIGGATQGALVFDGHGYLVGIVGASVPQDQYSIVAAGVEDTFSFGSGPYRLGQGRSVVNVDGTAVGNGQFRVVGVTVRNSDGVQVGVIEGDIGGQFHIISNGGSALEFEYDISSNGVVLDLNGARLEGFTYRKADGAIIDCNGDIRAFEASGGFLGCNDGPTTRYFDFGDSVYTIVAGRLIDEFGEAVGDGSFWVVGDSGTAEGARVQDADDNLVGIVGAKVGTVGYRIITAGVEATFSFGSGTYRLDQGASAVNTDGPVEGYRGFRVVGCTVFNQDGIAVGVKHNYDADEFYIISNGGTALEFTFSIGASGEVLNASGDVLGGFVFRAADGAVIDCNGDIRAFLGGSDCGGGSGGATRYFDFGSGIYVIADSGALLTASGSTVGGGFIVVGGATQGSFVYDGHGVLVGVVGEMGGQGGGYLINSAGAQATFSFGTGTYRRRQDDNVLLNAADGSAVANGAFSVVGQLVLNAEGAKVGVVQGDIFGEFQIISNGGSGVDFTYRLSETVLGLNGAVLEGFRFRFADGAIIDDQGDFRAFYTAGCDYDKAQQQMIISPQEVIPQESLPEVIPPEEVLAAVPQEEMEFLPEVIPPEEVGESLHLQQEEMESLPEMIAPEVLFVAPDEEIVSAPEVSDTEEKR